MKKGNFPSRDESFDTWQSNFMTIIVANAIAWNLGSLTALQAAQSVWAAAWALAKVKTTRNIGQVTAKDEARTVYEALLRPFIQQYIMVNPDISNQDRDDMQIKPRTTQHTPIPEPDTVPQIDTKPLSGHRVNVYFKQEVAEPGSSGRGKPKGVAFCEFAYKVGGTAPVGPKECQGRVLASRSPGKAEFEAEEAGQKVYVFARWVNPRGESGAWTEMTDFIVP